MTPRPAETSIRDRARPSNAEALSLSVVSRTDFIAVLMDVVTARFRCWRILFFFRLFFAALSLGNCSPSNLGKFFRWKASLRGRILGFKKLQKNGLRVVLVLA